MPVTEVGAGVALGALAEAAGPRFRRVDGDGDTLVSGLSFDSRSVTPGDLFFCVPGGSADGHRFAPNAVERGAAALCVQRPTGAGVPELVVDDVRRAMGLVAARFFGDPAAALLMLGVTGTNGKTTTAYLAESIARAAGLAPGLIGTIQTRFGDQSRPGVRTTPESVDLQHLLADMVAAGARAVVMEVTSHALSLHRVEGIHFAAAAFTNLSQDHLDFHRDMEDYFEAKRSLFRPERVRVGVVNLDDPYGRRIKDTAGVDCIGFGAAPDADVRAEEVEWGPRGTSFRMVTTGERFGDERVSIATPLVGAFNVSNALAAAALTLAAGAPVDAVKEGINALEAVPGRFEPVDQGQPFTVVVDYAHTPDSLDNTLRAARRLVEPHGGRVLCLFGCGGDRDRSKRPLMGAAAARLADVVVVSSDNPRSEVPGTIIAHILEGVIAQRADGPDAVIEDRREGIRHLLGLAHPGDIAVIAGKGHETGQELADRIVPFDDRAVARDSLRDLGWDGRGHGDTP